MRYAFAVVGVFVATLAFPHTSQAQAVKGDKEVLIQGSLISTLGDFGFTNATGVLGLGYFVSDRTQIGVQPIISVTASSQPTFNSRTGAITGSETVTTTTLGSQFKLQYYFGADQSKVKPYVGGSYIINDFSAAGDTSFVAGIFGLKSYFTEKAALDINASYGSSIKSEGSGILQVFAGISYIF